MDETIGSCGDSPFGGLEEGHSHILKNVRMTVDRDVPARWGRTKEDEAFDPDQNLAISATVVVQTGRCSSRGDEAVAIPAPGLFGRVDGVARWLTRWLLGGADVSMVLTEYNRRDAELLKPKHIAVVPNGIPDPCPDFEESVLPVRRQRAEAGYPGQLRLLFLGHCMESKGLHTSVRILAEVRRRAGRETCLTVAGKFPSQEEKEKFDSLVGQLGVTEAVKYVGFADEQAKRRLFVESDLLLFPTQYPTEAQPLVVIESLAFGVPVLVSRWRGVPELLPPGDPGRNDGAMPGEYYEIVERILKVSNLSSLRLQIFWKLSLPRLLMTALVQ
ncbi:MAG: glycosyltransferase [Blastochloris sp.]|nr:glycosyltransferase [Blastochloris sp.]